MNAETQTTEYTIERLTSTNLADVERLYKAVYGRILPPGFLLKKYDTVFTAVKYVGFIAYNKQRTPIGYYGVIPCFMWIDDKRVLAAQSADTMTHPGYRNKGFFTELAQLTYALCRNNRINFVFGFPNQNSLPGFINKLGWQMTERMDCFIIPVNRSSWIRFFKKLPFVQRMLNRYQQVLLNRHSVQQHGVANSVFANGFGGVYRDYDYLNYKTYAPAKVIEMANSTLWVKAGTVLLIGDICLAPGDFDSMMYQVKKLASNLFVNEIHFHASPGTSLHHLFSERFKPIPSFPVIFKVLHGDYKLDEIKFTAADIDTF